MGGGLSVSALRTAKWDVSASAYYQTVWDNDVSGLDFDKRTRGFNAGAMASRSFAPVNQYLRLWAGPMYVDDLAENYLWGSSEPVRHEPETHWGVATGLETVLWKHVSGLAYAIFLENPQWRVGLAWRVEVAP
jgi:hypothetical protein